jgi:hypothetical protein
LAAEPAAAARARAFLERTLAEAGVDEGRRFEALLVTSELVTNAVCHGSRPGDEMESAWRSASRAAVFASASAMPPAAGRHPSP